jgi:hypothetical protein
MNTAARRIGEFKRLVGGGERQHAVVEDANDLRRA